MKNSASQTGNSRWNILFFTGGAAALIAGIVFRRNLDAEFLLLRGTGIIDIGPASPPTTITDWFALLQNNKLLGLTLLNVFDLVNYALVGLIFLTLCVVLWRDGKSLIALAGMLGFTGIAVYFASNQAFSVLYLSSQYAAATTDAQRSLFLAAGQAALAVHYNAGYQGTGIYPSFFLVSTAGLIISAVMLRSSIFSRATACLGILANVFGLGYYVALVLLPAMVFLPLSVSAIFLLAWYILIGCRLLRLGMSFRKRETAWIRGPESRLIEAAHQDPRITRRIRCLKKA